MNGRAKSSGLRCSVGKCKAELLQTDRALITPCCHIFCVNCGLQNGLKSVVDGLHSGPPPACPACQAPCQDAAIVSLNPQDEQRATALLGLRPNSIMEYASHALSFWEHHAMEELHISEDQRQRLASRYNKIRQQSEALHKAAGGRINNLEAQVQALERDNHDLRQECTKLAERFKQQHQRLLAVQEQYDRLASRSGIPVPSQPASITTLADLDLPDNLAGDDLGNIAFSAAISQPQRGTINFQKPYQRAYGRTSLAQAGFGRIGQVRTQDGAGQGRLAGTPSAHRGLNHLGLSSVPGVIAEGPYGVHASGSNRGTPAQPYPPIPGNGHGGLAGGLHAVPGVKTSNANSLANIYRTVNAGLPAHLQPSRPPDAAGLASFQSNPGMNLMGSQGRLYESQNLSR